METYEQLLDDAYKKIKKVESSSGRFEIPKVEGHFEGKKTIITNVPARCELHHLNFWDKMFIILGKVFLPILIGCSIYLGIKMYQFIKIRK